MLLLGSCISPHCSLPNLVVTVDIALLVLLTFSSHGGHGVHGAIVLADYNKFNACPDVHRGRSRLNYVEITINRWSFSAAVGRLVKNKIVGAILQWLKIKVKVMRNITPSVDIK